MFQFITITHACILQALKAKKTLMCNEVKQTIIEVTEFPFPYKPPKDITTLTIAQIKSMTSRHLVSTIIKFVHIMTPLNTKTLSTYILLCLRQKYQLSVFIFMKYKTLSHQSIIFLFSKPINKKHTYYFYVHTTTYCTNVFIYLIYLYLKFHKSYISNSFFIKYLRQNKNNFYTIHPNHLLLTIMITIKLTNQLTVITVKI